MGAITPTKALGTEFGGDHKVVILDATPASASDTVTLTTANSGLSTILGVIPIITTGQDAALTTVHATFSGLVITIVTLGQDGANATDWTGANVRLFVIGY